MKVDIIFLLDGLTNQLGISGEKFLENDLLKKNIRVKWYNYNPQIT